MPEWKTEPPKNDGEYFERMTRALFAAGLNWRMIDNKWPNFKKSFSGFSLDEVSKFSEKDVGRLMKDVGIVRNEKKIRATVYNARQVGRLAGEFGSFRKYLDSFGKDEDRLQEDLRVRFHHLGASTARMFLWMVGYPLTPNKEEKTWMAGHH